MPNASGKTSFGKTDYTTEGVNYFADDFVMGFSPYVEAFMNEETNDSSQFTPSALTFGVDGQLDLGIPNAYDVDNAPLEPSENLESVYSNINAQGSEIRTFGDESLPGQVKSGNINYDSYNATPEILENHFSRYGSEFSIEGLGDTRPPEPSTPDFAQLAFEHNQAMSNAQGGGIESMILDDPKGIHPGTMAVGTGIEATGGGVQNLEALAEPAYVEDTLDSALNNINSNYNNNFNGIL